MVIFKSKDAICTSNGNINDTTFPIQEKELTKILKIVTIFDI